MAQIASLQYTKLASKLLRKSAIESFEAFVDQIPDKKLEGSSLPMKPQTIIAGDDNHRLIMSNVSQIGWLIQIHSPSQSASITVASCVLGFSSRATPAEIKAALKERRQDPVMLDSSIGLLQSNFKEFVTKVPEENLRVEYLADPTSGSPDIHTDRKFRLKVTERYANACFLVALPVTISYPLATVVINTTKPIKPKGIKDALIKAFDNVERVVL